MIERKPIRFAAWKPVARDNHIRYQWLDGAYRSHPAFSGARWQVVKSWIAESAIHTGRSELRVWGGLGCWTRLVTITQAEAEAFFEDAIARGHFTLRGVYRRALKARERRTT